MTKVCNFNNGSQNPVFTKKIQTKHTEMQLTKMKRLKKYL